ncbi:MAG: LPS export ABC transporter periplasmic protein LptC [Candidatus Velthaea sp.]
MTASATPAPAATATPTPLAVHVETKSSGNRYVTMVQQTRDRGSRKARTVYELRALSSAADRGASADAVVTFEQPHIVFHDKAGKTLTADAPKAKVTQRDKSVVMSGGVHAQTQDGGVLTCDRLRYDGRTERMHGDGHVTLSGPNGYSMSGDRLDGDVRLDDVRISAGGG